ncbi:hypothetical protein SUDANB6_05953 [Streptomyces sp. enrichment culture]
MSKSGEGGDGGEYGVVGQCAVLGVEMPMHDPALNQ